MFKHDIQRTGLSPLQGKMYDYELLWSFTTGGAISSSPACGDVDGDGRIEVVVGSQDNYLYALNGENGSLVWAYNTNTFSSSSPTLGDIDGDGKLEVVIGSLSNNVYALNAENGSLLWSYSTGYRVRSSPALADMDADGNLEVVVGSMDNTLYALNGEDLIPPLPFSLIAPLDSAILAIVRPTFMWESSSDLESGLADYDVYIDNTLQHTLDWIHPGQQILICHRIGIPGM